MHSTEHILLVRPAHFNYNPETALSNSFQNDMDLNPDTVIKKAIEEFNDFADRLRNAGVDVYVVNDTLDPPKPDAVFPNNWVSFHHDGKVILYPMCAANRRHERRIEIIDLLRKDFEVGEVIDLSHYEKENRFLEGTGSVVFDHFNQLAYACISPRTDKELLYEVCKLLGYAPVDFYAYDRGGQEIYHTNVMMCVAEKFAVICMECIQQKDRERVQQHLRESGHDMIEITVSQLSHFAGNMLSVKNRKRESVLVMSQSAFESLDENQITLIRKHAEILPMPIKTIESIGGGSARCMMAEIFLPKKISG